MRDDSSLSVNSADEVRKSSSQNSLEWLAEGYSRSRRTSVASDLAGRFSRDISFGEGFDVDETALVTASDLTEELRHVKGKVNEKVRSFLSQFNLELPNPGYSQSYPPATTGSLFSF